MNTRIPKLVVAKSYRSARRGSIVISVILIIALLALGVIVGGVAIRNQITQEFGDAATALDQLDQSFSYSIEIDTNKDGDFTDPEDFQCAAGYNDPAPTLTDPNGAPSAGIVFTVPTVGEGPAPTPAGTLP
ncbi:hypothetical protein C5Y96_18560 [Blastopirellula marina]|uniref:Type 4 fimbrial biogenesis protein PilX N-terminal domain-containing protein n=1 Tax=Blastopirellula marina TaxID=124 RepID=A0A2S8F6H3_9BACT|nr:MULTISPECIES: hypothetical protein [Pirellulaceae]PQO27534.1 hypothetical protein C5Y96_18560 [Blastopirellula marina]RCS48071.1 hypothetical protein DTL36_18585 [Bremerella cremea]